MDHGETAIDIIKTFVVLLFYLCFLVILVYVFDRWFLRHDVAPVHHLHFSRIVSTTTPVLSSRGLHPRTMHSIPTFVYESSKTQQGSPLECAVCLSEFEDGEMGRVLPNCNHCFHVECIDMWLQSHRDCPLCRAQVEVRPGKDPIEHTENPIEGSISIRVDEETCSGCKNGGVRVDCGSSS